MKSSTCKGSNNQFLEEYHSEVAARIDAERIKKEYDRDVEPYQCRTCSYWHVQTVSKTRQCMFCTDSALFLKDIYSTRQEAEVVAARVGKENRIKLYPYKCPHTSGWHLTKAVPNKKSR